MLDFVCQRSDMIRAITLRTIASPGEEEAGELTRFH